MKKLLYIILLISLMGCTNTSKTSESTTDKEEYNVIRGINLSQEGKYLEALREFEKAYGKNDKNIITLREMGLVYAQLSDYKKSEEFYKKALVLDERDQTAIKNLALLSYVKGDYEKSEEYLESVSKDSIDNMVLKLKGFISFKKGENIKAYDILKRALYLESDIDMEFYSVYSQVLLEESKFMELYKVLESGYEKYSLDKDYILFYTRILSVNYSEHDKAEKTLKRYMAENGIDDELLLLLSKISFTNGDMDSAENSLKMISDDYKYDLEYLNLKKDILDKSNKSEEAQKINILIERLTKGKS
ncbi:tetratricopeptide repeat protein [Ilyobacter polytropus]|uniref:TPR repeat-containing protein n=1 Tax=Ilyobacter polytropus (strain ATCC 51220 / DSM 2926 / LMG 16218 / CuHBu1) TaxID=572544 RepID=E3H6V1_ILYPC|nr:tetratricopeptide repeat protein [Ilyobacter polytropus]ADO82470.1 TPR repeat-containing protein [Ilyobacter polytropus DSM 2926]